MGPNIPAFRRYRTATGYEASIEVTGSDAAPIIYLCVPAFYVDTPIAYHWFKYTINRNNGRVVAAIDGDQYAPQSFEPDMMGNTDAFTHDTSAAGGVHWAPILIDEDRGAGISIEQIHTRYQIARDGATGLVNTLKQMVLGQDISERAQKMWQHVTVRGKLIQGHFTDGDWGPDHTMDYNDGEDTPMGPFYEIHDPQAWPGLDWDMAVRPDKPYNYLQDVALADVRVEIEHFALQTGDPGYVYENSDDPVSYWPTTGHYLQATGRWVIDNGHSYTEIHPPELLAVTYLRTYGSATAVTATGAWLGGELTFVANPPPRPSADARLRWGIYRLDGGQGYDRQDNAELIMEPQGPADNPNHVLCRLRQTAPATLILYDNGVVGMTRTRGLTCVVKAWWNATTATATGTVNDGAKPALGAFVFYRDESIPRSPWRAVRVNNQGTFSIPELAIGKPYRFVVAGSGWYFPLGRVTKTLTGTDTPMNFVGNRVRNAGVPAALGTFTQYGRNRSVSLARPGAPPPRPRTAAAQRAAAGAIQPSLGTSGTSLVGENAAMQTIQSILVSLDEPSDVYGVAQNGLGYAERGTVYFRLQGLAGPDGQPTTDLKSAYSVDTSGPAPTITVNGTPSTGVAGARIRVRMLLGNEWTGYRTTASVDSVTGYNGLARLRFIAGSSVEEMTLDVEVLENPYNPWFLPRVRGSVHLFYPSSSLGGLVYPYRLEVNSFDAGTLKAGQMRTARAASEEDRRLMRTLSRTEGAQSARGKRPIAAAKPKKLKVVK